MDQTYSLIDGIKCYAPELAINNADYPSDLFNFLMNAEEKNFWFQSRNKIIQQIFNKYVGNEDADVLEIGCGTGFVLRGLKEKFPKYTLTGSELHVEGIKYAKMRMPEVEFIQLDATNMPFQHNFDAIGAFDVIEHIDDDKRVIHEAYKALKPGGFLFISVPQYQWMWSVLDDIAYHKRRYSRKELTNKLHDAGYEIRYIGSFVFTLFPLMWISRFLKKKYLKPNENTKDKIDSLNELQLNPLINTIFSYAMKIDEILIRLGLSLPFGGSLIAVAQKLN